MVTLSPSEMRKLYGVTEGAQIVAFGRAVSTKIAKRTQRRQPTIEELYSFKPSKPEVKNLESEVVELI